MATTVATWAEVAWVEDAWEAVAWAAACSAVAGEWVAWVAWADAAARRTIITMTSNIYHNTSTDTSDLIHRANRAF